MRLILSTLFAAALVFFGTLLFAEYFGGIEVRDEQAETDASQAHDDRVVWHCPEVEELLTGSLPEGFSVGNAEWSRPDKKGNWPDENFVWPDESFVWTSSMLWEPFIETSKFSFAGDLYCRYIETGQEKDGLDIFLLSLAPGLLAELHPDSTWKKRERSHYGVFFECEEGAGACGFYVVEAE